jgi:hypothetical protein
MYGRERSDFGMMPLAMRLVSLLLVVLLPAMASATDVQGKLSGEHSWRRSGSPYVLRGDVTVDWSARLVIEAGVEVIAAEVDARESGVDPRRVELIVDGALVVQGAEKRPVTFTTREGGSWYGIRVRGGRGTVIDGAVISRAVRGVSLGMSAAVKNTVVSATEEDCLHVSYGTATLVGNRLLGCGRNGLYVDGPARVDAEGTVVTGCGGNGIVLQGGGELRHNTIHDNAESGVAMLAREASSMVRDSLITANGGHGVYKPGSATGRLRSNNVWGNQAGNYGAQAQPGAGSQSVDPRYVSDTDLRLRVDSPCRGVASDGEDMGALRMGVWGLASGGERRGAGSGRAAERSDATSITSSEEGPIRNSLLAAASARGQRIFFPERAGFQAPEAVASPPPRLASRPVGSRPVRPGTREVRARMEVRRSAPSARASAPQHVLAHAVGNGPRPVPQRLVHPELRQRVVQVGEHGVEVGVAHAPLDEPLVGAAHVPAGVGVGAAKGRGHEGALHGNLALHVHALEEGPQARVRHDPPVEDGHRLGDHHLSSQLLVEAMRLVHASLPLSLEPATRQEVPGARSHGGLRGRAGRLNVMPVRAAEGNPRAGRLPDGALTR